MLRHKLKGKNLTELLSKIYKADKDYSSNLWVVGELLKEFGYLTYTGDDHVAEFFSRYLTRDKNRIKKYKLIRTSVKERRDRLKYRIKWSKNILSGKETWDPKPSRETAADIISTLAFEGEFVDVMNVPNIGQISNLPLGSVVETLGLINTLGFTPLMAGELPKQLLGLVLPHVMNQDLIVESGIEGDFKKAFYALASDPLCSHLGYPNIRKMGKELLKANRKYLPQFFRR